MTGEPAAGARAFPRILVLFAHPAYHKSRAQRALVEAADGLAGVTFHDLYETYPDYDVDVPAEQARLLGHDLYVLQHPFYWYSVPPLLKQWIDLVLEHGWAYGRDGRAIRGRGWLHAISTGGREASYRGEGFHRRTVADFLAPLEATARLCGCDWLPPFVLHGTHAATPDQLRARGLDWRRTLEALRDGALDLDAVRAGDRTDVAVFPGAPAD